MSFTIYAAQTVTDRIEIDNDDIDSAILPNDLFGYQIENIGNLDGLGADDLAVIKFGNDTAVRPGAVLIMFMNTDGTVASTNEIEMTDSAVNGIGNVCLDNAIVNVDPGSLEQLAFVGDLNGNGMPTLAVGAP